MSTSNGHFQPNPITQTLMTGYQPVQEPPEPINRQPATAIVTDPASFAAAALKHITTSAIDKRTILRAQLSTYKTTRNGLEAKFLPIQTQHNLQVASIRKSEMVLEDQLKKLDDYLEGCEMVSQLSHDVAGIVPALSSSPDHKLSKPFKAEEPRKERIKRDPADRLCDADVAEIMRSNMNQMMSSSDIIKACPANKQGSARQGIWMSLSRLVKAGTIHNPKPGMWLYPHDAPPKGMMIVTAAVAKATIAAKSIEKPVAKTTKKKASVTTLTAAPARQDVTELVNAATARSAHSRETNMGNAMKKAGLR